MRYLIKYIFLFSLIFFSFYYADKVSTMIVNHSDLMIKIKSNYDDYQQESIDAIIENDHIIPGKKGIMINELTSYYQMKKANIFDPEKLVFKQVEPSISIKDHKDLVINKVLSQKKGIAIIIKNNSGILDYLKNSNIKITRLVDRNTFNKKASYEQISIDEKVDYLLNKYKMNKKICFNNYLSKESCIKKNKYLVESTYIIEDSRNINTKIMSGNILFLGDQLDVSIFKYILNRANYQSLSLYYLSDFISE